MANEYRLVFLDAATYGDISLQPFTDRWDCAIHATTPREQTVERLAGRHCAVLNKVVLDRATLEHPLSSHLALIAVAATGTDNVDLETARARGIAVCNVPGYASDSVAQFTISLLLELATRSSANAQSVRAGAWQESAIFTRFDFPSFELKGKRLGIVGYGDIGRKVAAMGRCLGMEVLVAERPGQPRRPTSGRVPLNDLLARADFLSLHCPLTPDTNRLIDRDALSLMKKNAFLINTARGGLVDEAALVAALSEGQIAGAALDVISQEPPAPDHPLIAAAASLDNLWLTPHCAWTAREARTRLMQEVLENITAHLRGERRNRVD